MRNWAPDTQGKERPRKRQTTPDWWVAGLIRELMKLVLGDHRTSCSLHLPTRILSYREAFTRFSRGLLQRVSTTHSSLKAESLKPAPAVERVGHLHSMDRAGGEELQTSRGQLEVMLWSQVLDDLLELLLKLERHRLCP